MPTEKISKNVADLLLAKAQELLDERNGNKSLTVQEQDVLFRAVNRIEDLLKVHYNPVEFDVLTGKMFFSEALKGEMLPKEELESIGSNDSERKVWRVMWKGRNSPCFYVEATFDFDSRKWNYSARTYYSKKPTDLSNIKVGWKLTPISEISSYNSPLEYAQKIAYAVMNGVTK